MNNSSLSSRGKKAADTVLRTDMEISFEAYENLYDPIDNPTGAFPLNIAENRLCWKELKEKFSSIARSDIPDWVMGYTSPLGDIYFRESLARFYERYIVKAEVNPEHLACSPGATGIIEMTSFILGEEEDVCVFPAPCYPVYKQDIGNISKLQRYDLVTFETVDEVKDGLTLVMSDLEKAKTDIESSGRRFRMLVLTTPDNPTGQVYSQDQIDDIVGWCTKRHIHVVINEIYALSRIDTTHPVISDLYDDQKKYSFGEILKRYSSDYLHHWYSFSKDFGISGFRVGVVYSRNEAFIKAYENLNLTHSISNHTQWLISELCNDQDWIDQYIRMNQKRLTESYAVVVSALHKANVPFVPAVGSLFVWADFSRFLVSQTRDAEESFWLDLYRSTGILLTPGHGFGHKGFGYFRIVYPYVSEDYLETAMEKLVNFLKEK